MASRDPSPGGVLLVDKPGGITSHDVVARSRRAFGTRRIGHAGTLDPMATGLLVLGIEGATRLLTYLVGLGKTYTATIRLGQATTTDDGEGDVVSAADAQAVAQVSDDAIAAGAERLTGTISQVPSAVSAIKVDGRRAYDRVRAGERVELAPREVTVSRLDVVAVRRGEGSVDLDVVVDCSSGTYIRALARDLGADLGVGGHLTALRRTHVGPFDVAQAVAVDDLDAATPQDPAEIAARVLGRFDATAEEARDLRHGKRLEGAAARLDGSLAAAVDPDGALIGVVERRGSALKSAMNMPEPRAGRA
ncbi:tRNA pseudouridine(55) synthase TruB [Microbacterium betulae]|uniref:tRNA pseudouridine synthase B n=1 Tax=Microbacterium betulae TaxID=2981139 RepID=A0AA97FEK1_9MICO|nr:tRNA pseudouridine(55) synthase TruB [Microbacterium sp. AB]WOF22071.1 tRNA pseudouridine(55) synthase TruB [Microbacterium sp. AB]